MDKRFSLASRLIHWAIAFTFLYLLLTVLLRLGWMNKGQMGGIIQSSLENEGMIIDNDLAGKIGKDVRRPMWNTHTIAGYVLCGLFIIRMVITRVQGAAFYSPLKGGLTGYQRFRSWVYVLFYVFTATSLLTGLIIKFGPDSIHDINEEIHKLSLYYMVAFIGLHLVGVVAADGDKERGIISKIISGEGARV
ncbi:cytochrome B [Flavobacterium akiainvivens]|uniref:Cytochrome B n=1 Tax=Flavobacterium akiainvivens TaxID=1202724 RepID=A0A0M9VHW9_9FLAO|nr:cytochrome b/b6 domain-containing protein [Flavobacterium akiainvivens]KOS06020.1 cytochrome B [Flavobacterium akiainvivens]SFQ54286.1 Cytochrome b561 [Flavobacterium akiainvivens]